MTDDQKRRELTKMGWHQRWVGLKKEERWIAPSEGMDRFRRKPKLLTLADAWFTYKPVVAQRWGQWQLRFDEAKLHCTVRNIVYDEVLIDNSAYKVSLDISNAAEILAALLDVTYQPWAAEEANAFVVGQLLVALSEIFDIAPPFEGSWDPKEKLEEYRRTWEAETAVAEMRMEDEDPDRIAFKLGTEPGHMSAGRPNLQNVPMKRDPWTRAKLAGAE